MGQTHAEYVQHNLIDDAKFLDAASMNQEQIQSFLQARGSYLAGYTPYSDRDGGNVPASRIIYEAAQDYGISPKVLLATMQKEQSLVTAKNPTQKQLDRAMGYGCPDTAECNIKYGGFYKQLDNASWQLRYNFERARGNNTWWRVSSSYACGSTTRYYSTGLYVGRYVVFYDDHGHAYKEFTLNNASTASLYCYTPHAYPGSWDQYYSGSYNFVVKYEEWFGSTQPDVVITSPLRISTIKEGTFTGQRFTFSFDLYNSAPWPMGIGTTMIAVRDSQGRNYDFGPQQIVLQPKSGYTYTASAVFDAEETYTFSIANNYNGWNDTYPSSSSIDHPRKMTKFVQAMPTITSGPAVSGAEQRVGKNTTASFQVKNNSAQPLNLGRIGMAVRDERGGNFDLPYDLVPAVAAGQTYTYSKLFAPAVTGRHDASVSLTLDNGATWDDGSFPTAASGVSRRSSYTVRENPTLTTGLSISNQALHVNQPATLSFQVKNHGDKPVNIGRIGLAMRAPNGQNYDPRWDDVTLSPGQTYTYSINCTFDQLGTWRVSIGNYNPAMDWNSHYPRSESGDIARQIEFNVRPSVTVTTDAAMSGTEFRANKAATASFSLKNFSNRPITMEAIGLAARGPKGENLDLGWDRNVTIAAGATYTYTRQAIFKDPGRVRLSIGAFSSGAGWTDGPPGETDAIKRSFSIDVRPSPTVTTGVTLSDTTPQINQPITASFQIKNHGDTAVTLEKIGLAIRSPENQNYDPRWDTVTIAAGQTYTYSVNLVLDKVGKWNMAIGNYNPSMGWNSSYPWSESGDVQRAISTTVAP